MLHQHHQKVPFQTVPNTTITIYRNIRLLLGKAVSVPLLNLFESGRSGECAAVLTSIDLPPAGERQPTRNGTHGGLLFFIL